MAVRGTRKRNVSKEIAPAEVGAKFIGSSTEVDNGVMVKDIEISSKSDNKVGIEVCRYRIFNNSDTSMPISIFKESRKITVVLQPYSFKETEMLTEEILRLASINKLVINKIK